MEHEKNVIKYRELVRELQYDVQKVRVHLWHMHNYNILCQFNTIDTF